MSYKIEYYNKIKFYIGLNAKGNFDIIDLSDSYDLWFHIDNKPSCHVIAFIPNNIDDKNMKYIIEHGAKLCKNNSKYKLEKVKVIYTTIENVKKTKTIGSVEISNEKSIFVT